ncbi:conserved Plasmodium protein, unknown function [Plasmodium berghei]|uniref:Uncharacterized protein n=2 Tax=Plasmodium berghei TaxID=5821 RepID=A0A509AJ29_PLABA|nr:conserved Plasmodium protein, unknown function [Plasmodium berghei ANKA]CXI12077.1 conserved Plasmodium protein, unknown function [Plasmodium berghei]SCL93310.1 conserved Plasmodium protein, unknown function [Plasmodium berghei]SCM15830.1 conserved Plasmodium protein, unknown function [Plasmodium berghei]SCM17625.1 conserved Plasmodium protein, unknown function [Plasmodium berghei]SCN23132.1 conserved Plasmodium protein, unknown function [Plasmodium berghei]|eukprot:XP_034420434.1 conserved Plasmodium protein, unknown function [Plasmodium berghei ANKA]
MGKKINIAIYLVLLNLFVCGIKYGESGIPVKKSVNLRNSYENKNNSQAGINAIDKTSFQDDQKKFVIEGNDENQPESKEENINGENKEKQPSNSVKVSDKEGSNSDTLKKSDGTSDKGDVTDQKEKQPDTSLDKKEDTLPKVDENIPSEHGVQKTPLNPNNKNQMQTVSNSGGDSPTDMNKTVQEISGSSLGDKKSQTGDANHVVQNYDKQNNQIIFNKPIKGKDVTPPGKINDKSANDSSSLCDTTLDDKQPNNEGSVGNKDNVHINPKNEDTSSDSTNKEKTQQKENATDKNSDKASVSDSSTKDVIDNTKGKTEGVQSGIGEDSNTVDGNIKTKEPSENDKQKEESSSIVKVPSVAPSNVPEQKKADANTLEFPPTSHNNTNSTNLNDTESNGKISNDVIPKKNENNKPNNNQTILEEARNDPKVKTSTKDTAVNNNFEMRYDNEEENENSVDESMNIMESYTGDQNSDQEKIEFADAKDIPQNNKTNENEKEKISKKSRKRTSKKKEKKNEPITIDSKAKKLISEYYANMKNIKNKIEDYVKSMMNLIDSNYGISKTLSNFSENVSNFIYNI